MSSRDEAMARSDEAPWFVGIGSVCGYGRVEPELLPEILRIHAEDANELELSSPMESR